MHDGHSWKLEAACITTSWPISGHFSPFVRPKPGHNAQAILSFFLIRSYNYSCWHHIILDPLNLSSPKFNLSGHLVLAYYIHMQATGIIDWKFSLILGELVVSCSHTLWKNRKGLVNCPHHHYFFVLSSRIWRIILSLYFLWNVCG